MAGHSKTNGSQTRALRREMQILRSAQDDMRARLDSAVALADRQIGAGTTRGDSRIAPTAPITIDPKHAGPGATLGLPYGPISPAAEPPQEIAGRPDWMDQGTAQFSVPGTPILSGFVTDIQEYNPDLQARNAVQVYEKMRRGDGQVEATLQALILPVLSAEWKIVPGEEQREKSRSLSRLGRDRDDKQRVASTGAGKTTNAKEQEIIDFVKDNLFGGLEFRTATGGWSSQSWQEVVRNALLMLSFGCAAHEDVYTIDGDKIRLRLLADLLPLTFYRFHVDPDDGRTLLYLGQYGYRGARFEQVSVPADKLAVFVYRKEGANFWGRSVLRAAYPHWYTKNALYRIEAIGCERNSMGVPVIVMQPGFSKEDRQIAVNYATQLAVHERTGLVLPNGSTFDLVGVKGTIKDVQPAIRHHNEQITMGALEMFMNLGRTSTGSRALGGEQSKFFMLSLQSVATQVAEVMTNSTIRRLVAFNFGEDAPCPKLIAANVQARALEDIIEALSKLAMAGAWVSDRPARDGIRAELGQEPETDIGVVSIKGEMVTEGTDTGTIAGKSAGAVEGGLPSGAAAAQDGKQKASEPPLIPGTAPKAMAGGALLGKEGTKGRLTARKRDQVSPYWHAPVALSELHVNFSELDRGFDRHQSQLARVLARAKPRLARQAARTFAQAAHSRTPANQVVLPHDRALAEKVASELGKAYKFGAKQVREERNRAIASSGHRAIDSLARSSNDSITLADAQAKGPLPLIAEGVVQDVTTDVGNAGRKALIDLLRDVATGEEITPEEYKDRLYDAIAGTAYIDTGIDKAAMEGSRQAIADGRGDQLGEYDDELSASGGHYERSELLDQNTCAPCGAGDGEIWDSIEEVDWNPGDDCEGGDMCRGALIGVYG